VEQLEKADRATPNGSACPARAGDDACARIAADTAPVMLWISGAERRLDWFNVAWELYTGRSVDELRREGWLGLVHPQDVERCTGIYAASADARHPYALDYRLRRHDGSYRWVLENGMPRFDGQGAFTGYTGSVVEIHERKQFEERLAERTQALRLAERRQGSFLAMLSHELRNPLAPIANAASVLRTLEDREPVLVRLREILERQVGRLSRLVEDLIDVTRSAQGQITLITEHLAVEALVQNAVAASAESLNRAGHTLDVQLPEQRLHVRGDPARLVQALANIINNAAKFTREPSVITLEVRATPGRVEIVVHDPGQGIAPDFLPHVFELFAQQDQSLGRKPAGLGVGLTLSRRIAQLHNGNVEAFSEGPGKGACFVLSLPLAAPEAAGGESLDVPPLSESYRVLIIEDDDDSREALRLQMEMWNNDVRIAATAEEGLRAAASFKPHIVLCDIGLPGMDGLQLLGPLRTQLADQRTIFAAITGHARHEDEARALAVGYDSFLAKPMQPGTLARLLRSYAERA
jgi:PAS domain S-box-containing protein